MDVTRIEDTDHGSVEVSANGARQSFLGARFDLLPPLAVRRVAEVLQKGAEKYGVSNWKGLTVNQCLNHALYHAFAHLEGVPLAPTEDHLAHMACRALMALELKLTGGRGYIQDCYAIGDGDKAGQELAQQLMEQHKLQEKKSKELREHLRKATGFVPESQEKSHV